MNFEKIIFKKVSLWIFLLTIIFLIIFTIWFANLALRSSTAKKKALIPENLKAIFSDQKEDFKVGINKSKIIGLKKININPENYKDYILISRYDADKNRSVVEILDLSNNTIVHTWEPDITKINSFSKLPKDLNLKRDHNIKRYRINHPLLMANGDLIIHSTMSPLVKIDACSKVKWIVDKPFHHSTELDSEGNIWVPGIQYPPKFKGIDADLSRRDEKFFYQDTLEKISQKGEVLFSKSLIEIFVENNLEHLVFPGGESFDPFHLNDIQPALYDSKYWKKGDLFLSLRENSAIVLYRPSNNKVIWMKQGPWTAQHDVDILNETQIAVFNNNLDKLTKKFIKDNEANETLIYDFYEKKVFSPYRNAYLKNKIRTASEGLSRIFSNNNIFVEDQNHGKLITMSEDGKVVWQYINAAKDGNIYLLNWSRYLEKSKYKNTIDYLKTTKCNE